MKGGSEESSRARPKSATLMIFLVTSKFSELTTFSSEKKNDNTKNYSSIIKQSHTRLQVTMEIPPLMHMSESMKYLEAPVFHLILRKGLFTIFHELV